MPRNAGWRIDLHVVDVGEAMAEVDDFWLQRLQPADRVDRSRLELGHRIDVGGVRNLGFELFRTPDYLSPITTRRSAASMSTD